MADISKITLPSGTTYDIKDATARELIGNLDKYTKFLGVTTTALSDGATTNPITIAGASVTAVSGNIATYGSQEFIFNGTSWQAFGDLSGLGALAYKDSASGSYKPEGTVSKPTFTGDSLTSTGKFTPEGSVSLSTTNKTATVSKASSGEATYTPEGTIAVTPTVTLNTTTVNSITNVGTLPELTTTVSGETLTIGFSKGTLPTKGANTTVATGVKSATASGSFAGTGARLVTSNIAVPNSASFVGEEGDVSVSGTPSGSVSQPTFSGTSKNVTVS